MPPRSSKASRPRTKRSPATPPRRSRAKSQPLAVTDAVKREPLRKARRLADPLAVLEPLGRSLLDRQVAVLEAAFAWSPARVFVNQQAAFWEGFVGAARSPAGSRQPKRKRARAAR